MEALTWRARLRTAVAKYVVVWKKEDGQWRLHRDIWNTKAT